MSVQVQVNGLQGELLKNVLSRLELNLHKENPRLKPHDIRRLHRQAKDDIRGALAPFGYYSPDITPLLTQNGEEYTADYTVVPGDPVYIRNIELKINGAGEQILQDALQKFTLKVGDILLQHEYENGKKQLVRAAVFHGFMKAVFSKRELRINRLSNEAEIQLTLDTGPQFLFGETTFLQDYLSHELLERYLPYRAGDPYKPSMLIELQRALYRTDYFSNVVVDSEVGSIEDPVVPVTVSTALTEKLNRYSFGLGYATDTGARAKFEWRNRLLNTKGHRIRGSTQVSEFDNQLGLSYEVPWGNPRTDSMAYSATYYDQIWDDTETRLLSTRVYWEHKGNMLTHGTALELRDEDYSVGETSGEALLLMPSYTGTLIWADDLLDTKYGLKMSLSVSGGSESFGSDISFLKAVAGGKVILSFLPGWRFIGRGNIGAVLVDSIDDLPPSLRFYTGGDQSIRGYSYNELGTTDASGAVIGGRYLVVGSAEIEKQLTESFSGAAFWDVGNAVDDLSLDFKQGIGVGVRYRLPFGQIKIDLASAVSEDSRPVRLHITVGADL